MQQSKKSYIFSYQVSIKFDNMSYF